LAFRQRLIFISENALSRPDRTPAKDDAINTINLDV
jgi:hypothetical protein